jgi:pyruvate formate-lyase/glycerol dehydratase family glycyl radical enzyme
MVKMEVMEEINRVSPLTGRVEKRMEELFSATPHLCAERSRLVTESWKETEGEPLHIRRAKLFKKMLEGISVVIHEGELIVGSETKYVKGASPPVDFNCHLTFEVFESEHVRLSGLVKVADVTEDEKESLLEDARYWKGKSTVDATRKARHEVFGDKVDPLHHTKVRLAVAPDVRPVSSRVPDYEKALGIGLNGIIAEAQEQIKKASFLEKDTIKKYYFWQSVIIACEGVIHFAHRYADLARNLAKSETDAARKAELEKIADACEWVPAHPPRTFYEALQGFWFIHLGIHLEASQSNDIPGRMDQYLYPFYKKDIDEGRLTRQEAAELIACLRVKFSQLDNVRGKIFGQTSQTNLSQNVVIGGVRRDGTDASNELTYLFLEVARQVRTPQPPLNLRIHPGTPMELWMKAVEVNVDRGDGVPVFLNDGPLILNFVGRGMPLQEARDWASAGCVHPVHYAFYCDKQIYISIAKIFEVTLYNGFDPGIQKQIGPKTGDPREFSSYEELYDAFKKQVDYFATLLAEDYRLFWQVRNEHYSLPFVSSLTLDCIEKGKGITEGGVRYPQFYAGFRDRGHQDVADSLASIKKLVFEERKITMAELLEALAANFEKKEELRLMLRAAPKYGNDDDYVDDIHNDLSLWTQYRLSREKHPMGTDMQLGRGGASWHVFFGKGVGALPNGRKAGTPLADGSLSPAQGVDVKGPTAVINSATKVNHTELSYYSLFNLKFSKAAVQTQKGMRTLISLIKTYFERGGYMIQFNLMGQETLIAARNNPEKYRDLLVRVAGYSAYFVDLSPDLQDEIISRTEHAL